MLNYIYYLIWDMMIFASILWLLFMSLLLIQVISKKFIFLSEEYTCRKRIRKAIDRINKIDNNVIKKSGSLAPGYKCSLYIHCCSDFTIEVLNDILDGYVCLDGIEDIYKSKLSE